VRLQYQSLAGPEAFETDWAGKASYYMAGKPASFSLTLGSADADVIAGKWDWELSTGARPATSRRTSRFSVPGTAGPS
jgi:hypothetical protein